VSVLNWQGLHHSASEWHTANTGTPRVVRYGSKGLSKWQRSYGPTTLELLGMVTSVLDCASYIRGRHFVLECDHQALKPLFQKQLKGAIYERWLAISTRGVPVLSFWYNIYPIPLLDVSTASLNSKSNLGNASIGALVKSFFNKSKLVFGVVMLI
jgi:hypothetical protein